MAPLTFLALALIAPASAPQSGFPAVIRKGTKLPKGTFVLPSPGDERGPAAVVIEGDNLTVDLSGVVLRGSPATIEPSDRKGVGVEIRGRNVTVKNPRIHGYKVALIARNAPGLKILGGDLSYNWKQRLGSTQEREDLADWMSYHQNEKDEWLRYGGAIYLRDSDNFEVKGVRIHGGQNALMITGCDKGRIWNNDFSFNSSLGLGMYRSSDNKVMHNRMDWNVRGYSHGVYNRGQDSAGILIYEQSHRNTFAYNSVTHGGDGFFLWAGQSTMDTGKGGCNDNLLYGNDWSHAPTNGIEATFSRNNFVNNLLLECWHGIWGGYSYDSKVVGNVFGLNAEAIAWEHGQNNLVSNNLFLRENDGIYLWSNERQDPNWAYPKTRDTRSRDWVIKDNYFRDVVKNALRVRRTEGVTIQGNVFDRVGKVLLKEAAADKIGFVNNTFNVVGMPNLWEGYVGSGENATNFAASMAPMPPTMQPSGNVILGLDPEAKDYLKRFDVGWTADPKARLSGPSAVRERINEIRKFRPEPLAGAIDPFIKPGALRGRRYILVDHWGPYDFKRPLLWPRGEIAAASSVSVDASGRQSGPNATTVRRFEVLGPKGRWRVVGMTGVDAVSAQSGTIPGYIDVTLPKGRAGLTKLELEYVGGETTDYRGITTKAGQPVRFAYERFFAPIDWTVKFFKWSKSEDPAEVHANPDEAALKAIFAGAPLKELKVDRLDYAGYAFDRITGNDHYATTAEGTFEIPEGDYVLELTTDDGARVWLDDKPLIADAWKYQGPTAYTRNVRLGGKHRLRVEHFQIDGYATLKLNLRPR